MRTQGLDIQQLGRTEKGSKVIIKQASKHVDGCRYDPQNVDKPLKNVDNKILSTSPFEPDREPDAGDVGGLPVDNVDECSSLSGSIAHLKSEKNEETKEEREGKKREADSKENLPTSSTVSTAEQTDLNNYSKQDEKALFARLREKSAASRAKPLWKLENKDLHWKVDEYISVDEYIKRSEQVLSHPGLASLKARLLVDLQKKVDA